MIVPVFMYRILFIVVVFVFAALWTHESEIRYIYIYIFFRILCFSRTGQIYLV